jgi:steroid delta-isomerase-like uncharacterized protein
MTDRSWLWEYLDAWNAHDGDAVVSWMTDDAVYEDVALGQMHKGKEAIRTFVNDMESNLSSDYRFEAVSEQSTDTAYHTEWRLCGTHDRDGGGLPATNKQFEIRGVSVGTLQDGKIKTNRDYWNMADFLAQIGILPPMPVSETQS